ncbi:MAG: DNA polymerase III subunit beta, partial [Candidatus Methanospirareceae archaeon]
MKIEFDRKKMLSALRFAGRLRSSKPILQNAKLEATADVTVLTATDLEVGIRMELTGIEIEIPGNVLLPIKKLISILRGSSDEKLCLESDKHKTIIRDHGSKFNLPSANPDEFPIVAEFTESKYHKLSSHSFCKLVDRTVFAAKDVS